MFVRIVATVALALSLVGCGGVPADIPARIAAFQAVVNAGRLAEARSHYYRPVLSGWEGTMARRVALGRMLETAEAASQRVSAQNTTLVVVTYNSRFENGEALETFSFRVDERGSQLDGYGYQIGKRQACPLLSKALTSCWIEDVPKATASR